MVVYADILLLVNMYTDYFLLLGVKRFLRLKASGLRLFLGALSGGVTGLSCLIPLPDILRWLMLLLSAVLICLVSFHDGRACILVKSSLAFFIFSLILSGAVFLLAELLNFPAAVIGGRVYFELSPLLLLVFTVGVYLVSLLAESILGPRDSDRSLKFALIGTELGRAEVLMKNDTGNSLKEPFSGLPAAVVELDAILPIVPPAVLEYLSGGSPKEGLRLIPCRSLGGDSLLPAFKPDHFRLKDSDTELNCYIAVSKNRLGASAWRGLLSPEIL